MDVTHTAAQALASLWHGAALTAAALDFVDLPGADPVLPSSFAVGAAAQASLAAAALAAAQVGHRRNGLRQRVRVDALHAALDSAAWFRIDGKALPAWDKLSGLYRCGAAAGEPGWVRIHTNFTHHRDAALRLLGLAPGAETSRDAVLEALQGWRAEDFETAAAAAGGVAAAVRSFAQWDAHPQALALAGQAPISTQRIGDAAAPALPWPPLRAEQRPLHGLRVLDLTRILAGPVAGRTLAAYGAEVMLVNSPTLPNIDAIADTSRGKLSAQIDLKTDAGRATLRELIAGADVFLHGYRPGALAALGFGPPALASLKPGIVVLSLAAHGFGGPWAGRRGFDSLVQTASGFNVAEAAAAGADAPRALPIQILDYAAGYLLAFGASTALLRQRVEGGSWEVRVSLAGVGHWLRVLGRVATSFDRATPSFEPFAEDSDSGFGRLRALRHAAVFSHTPAGWTRPSMPPGSHPPRWPEMPA